MHRRSTTTTTPTPAPGYETSARPAISPGESSKPTSARSGRRTSKPAAASTPSPGSGCGNTLSISPDGQMRFQFGPGVAPASRSATLDGNAGRPTSATSGRSGSGSSASADLPSSLGSRLQAALASRGSTLFRMTWKERVTPSGRRIYALRASAPRTLGKGCSSWPTCQARDWQGGQARRHFRPKSPRNLSDTVTLSSWATRDWKSSASNKHGQNARPLNEQARLASWATPASQEAGGTAEQFLARKVKAARNGARMGVSLTSLSLQATLADSGPRPTGSHAETAKPGQPGTFPLAHGHSGRVVVVRPRKQGGPRSRKHWYRRVGVLRCIGNAIVPQVAAVFIEAALSSIRGSQDGSQAELDRRRDDQPCRE